MVLTWYLYMYAMYNFKPSGIVQCLNHIIRMCFALFAKDHSEHDTLPYVHSLEVEFCEYAFRVNVSIAP